MSLYKRGFFGFILTILFLSTVQSCDRKRFFEENTAIPKSSWNVNEKVKFRVNITDLQSRYSFFINVRNADDYKFSNLYLFMHTNLPNGRITRDTIECQLADYDGKWLGSGVTGLKFNRFLFQKGVRFPVGGEYLFTIEQAMRVSDLKGITDIGIRIEKE